MPKKITRKSTEPTKKKVNKKQIIHKHAPKDYTIFIGKINKYLCCCLVSDK